MSDRHVSARKTRAAQRRADEARRAARALSKLQAPAVQSETALDPVDFDPVHIDTGDARETAAIAIAEMNGGRGGSLTEAFAQRDLATYRAETQAWERKRFSFARRTRQCAPGALYCPHNPACKGI